MLRSWREQKVMLRLRFTSLNDKDFDFVVGEKEDMLNKLALKLKKTREQLEYIFAELQKY